MAEPTIWDAALDGKVDALTQFLDDGMSVDADEGDGWTPLLCASSEGQHAIIALLLERGADITKVTENGHTALHRLVQCAAWRNDRMAPTGGFNDDLHGRCLKGVLALLAAGADPNQPKPETGETPLHDASSYGLTDIVLALAMTGDVELRDADHRTPLMMAAGRGHPTAMDALVEAGADVNAEWKHGFRAIHFAAEHGEVDPAISLKRHGADLTAAISEDFEGYKAGNTALEVARKKKRRGFVKWFTEATAGG